ncbi:MAG TPA: putative zinc-binding metallopeptidase, partial [Polyangiaceae bacterium]|nr:putative zinc-binding metallopeptidase [Polyangiaceae bacterium]
GPSPTPHGQYRKCANYLREGVCNWLVPADSSEELCQACRLNDVIPNLSEPENHRLWHEVEQAKRRLIYSLDSLDLPLLSKRDDPEKGLSFDIKQSIGSERVLTGHAEGLITLNLSEADDAQREKMRMSLNERYRTLLGHFRHEIGHYYWDRLVADPGGHEEFRALFGDERADYAEALKTHYSKPVDPNYSLNFISNYAASHPWEDFAETFAHYLHMVDTLETAEQYGFASLPPTGRDFEGLMAEWYRLTVALNALNRSMGLADAYPFAITPPVKQKLSFVHELVHAARRASSEATFSSSTRAGPGMSELSASTAV